MKTSPVPRKKAVIAVVSLLLTLLACTLTPWWGPSPATTFIELTNEAVSATDSAVKTAAVDMQTAQAKTPEPTMPGFTALGTTRTRPSDGMVMVYVPAGEYMMGSAEEDREAFEYEKPRHLVYVDAFWIDRTEVTNAQYRRCVEAGVCREPSCWINSDFNAPDQSVSCVNWYDAQLYCGWAGARLLTEAEWGYAARGPNGSIYPWGDAFDGARLNYCDASCTFGWRDARYDDGHRTMAPVGSFSEGASWCGALDMSGNVWEWVSDWYGDYPSTKQTDPTGPETGSYKVVRGGAWDDVQARVRAASRYGGDPGRGSSSRGVRCGE